MTTAFDVPKDRLISEIAAALKKDGRINVPDWASFVKTGVHREMPPEDPDWWYIRMAAVLRKTYVNGPIGISRLTAEYGGSRDRGAKPNRARKGSGSIARHCVQELESMGYLQKDKNRGRVVTPVGRSFVDNTANKVAISLKDKIPALEKY